MPVKEPASLNLESVVSGLRSAGFQVTTPAASAAPDRGAAARVEKGRCAAVLEQVADGIRFAEPPGYLLGGEIARLVDRGYQKYLVTPRLKVPALAEHLTEIHRFGEEMRAALGIPSLYNEALGTVSDRYLYDRVSGRE